MLGIDHPLIVAPMFLVSNTRMIKAAQAAGATGAFPALNYRTDAELRAAIRDIRAFSNRPFGVNLIVNRSNPKYKQQLKTLLDLHVDFIITSLGNPGEVIEAARKEGILVFCDVVDLAYAKKAESLGADGLIAVTSRAGGHAGNIPPRELISLLTTHCHIPVVGAGGIGHGRQLQEYMSWGAAGVSVGTVFIACEESDVSPEYKQAMIDYDERDIVMTTRLSGSPLTVINTPYVQKLGTKPNFLEWLLRRNRWMKKYIKMLIALRGMKAVEKAAFKATYQTVWCAGPAISHVRRIEPLGDIVNRLVREYQLATQDSANTPQN